MWIVVASGNIFRRELSMFVLSEAGHYVIEAPTIATLLEYTTAGEYQLLVVDATLARGDLPALRRKVVEYHRRSILWIVNGASDLANAPDAQADAWLRWPYTSDDLLQVLSRIDTSAPDVLLQPRKQRYAGDHS